MANEQTADLFETGGSSPTLYASVKERETMANAATVSRREFLETQLGVSYRPDGVAVCPPMPAYDYSYADETPFDKTPYEQHGYAPVNASRLADVTNPERKRRDRDAWAARCARHPVKPLLRPKTYPPESQILSLYAANAEQEAALNVSIDVWKFNAPIVEVTEIVDHAPWFAVVAAGALKGRELDALRMNCDAARQREKERNDKPDGREREQDEYVPVQGDERPKTERFVAETAQDDILNFDRTTIDTDLWHIIVEDRNSYGGAYGTALSYARRHFGPQPFGPPRQGEVRRPQIESELLALSQLETCFRIVRRYGRKRDMEDPAFALWLAIASCENMRGVRLVPKRNGESYEDYAAHVWNNLGRSEDKYRQDNDPLWKKRALSTVDDKNDDDDAGAGKGNIFVNEVVATDIEPPLPPQETEWVKSATGKRLLHIPSYSRGERREVEADMQRMAFAKDRKDAGFEYRFQQEADRERREQLISGFGEPDDYEIKSFLNYEGRTPSDSNRLATKRERLQREKIRKGMDELYTEREMLESTC